MSKVYTIRLQRYMDWNIFLWQRLGSLSKFEILIISRLECNCLQGDLCENYRSARFKNLKAMNNILREFRKTDKSVIKNLG